MTDTTVVLDDTHLAAAAELKQIMVEEKQLAARKDAAKKILAEILTEVGQTAVDSDGVIWASMKAGASRWDAELAKRTLPPKMLELISVSTPDKDLAKEILPPALYNACTKPGAPTIQAAR